MYAWPWIRSKANIEISEGQICAFSIETRSREPTFTSFLALWQAAVAVDAMCVRKGLKGIAFDLGMSCPRFVTEIDMVMVSTQLMSG